MDFAGLEAVGADTNPLARTFHNRVDRTQVHVPATPRGVVGVTDLVSKLRAFAADIADFCHVVATPVSTRKGFGKLSRACD